MVADRQESWVEDKSRNGNNGGSCHEHTNRGLGRSTDDGPTSNELRTWNYKRQG